MASITGERQVLVFGGEGLAGHSLIDGRELWFREWTNNQQINAAQPVVVNNEAIFLGSGYGKGSVLYQILVQDDSWTLDENPKWEPTLEMKLKFNSAISKDGFVYGLDEGILVCLDLNTGKRKWKKGRYGFGQMLLIDDLLLIQSESGAVALVETNAQRYQEVTRFQALENKTWNHPVVVNGRLLVRNAEEAACFDISAP